MFLSVLSYFSVYFILKRYFSAAFLAFRFSIFNISLKKYKN